MTTTILQLPVTGLHSHPANPRRDLGDLAELADSIRAHGVRQALVVVPHCEHRTPSAECVIRVKTDDGTTWCSAHQHAGVLRVVIGHRRLAAARMAGLTDVPVVIDDALSEADQLELMLLENIQRADLSPVEEAQGYQGLLDLGISVTMIAKRTGRARSTVDGRLKLLQLPDTAREKVHTRQATLEDAAKIAEYAGDPDMYEKLVDALGTDDLRWHLDSARRNAETAKTKAAIRAKLRGKGLIELQKQPNRTDYTEVLTGRFDTKPPKDLQDATHFRLDYYLYLYRPATQEESDKWSKADAAKARKAAREEAAAIEQAKIVDECDTATRLRGEWIGGLLALTKMSAEHRQQITATAARLMLLGKLTLTSWDTKTWLAKHLGQEKLDMAAWLDECTGPPEALILLMIHWQATPSHWSKGNWKHAARDETLVALYRLLVAIGYPLSDAERDRVFPELVEVA